MKSHFKVTQEDIEKASRLLGEGRLVAFPTETVYGLGADANNAEAVKKIFIAKGRPADHPLIVHLGDAEQLRLWAREIPDITWELARQFWPGPLTVILKRAANVCNEVTAGQDTIGLRVPGHPIALALLKAFDSGVAAPSANRFGCISPTKAEHVRAELGDKVDFILDGGDCDVGIESTILDLSSDVPRILRPGAITASQIEAVIKIKTPVRSDAELSRSIEGGTPLNIPRVSGMLETHYAPRTPLKIISKNKLSETIVSFISENKSIAVLAYSAKSIPENKNLHWLTMPNSAKEYAHELYQAMRAADAKQSALILVEELPEKEEYLAIRDRLQKASNKG